MNETPSNSHAPARASGLRQFVRVLSAVLILGVAGLAVLFVQRPDMGERLGFQRPGSGPTTAPDALPAAAEASGAGRSQDPALAALEARVAALEARVDAGISPSSPPGIPGEARALKPDEHPAPGSQLPALDLRLTAAERELTRLPMIERDLARVTDAARDVQKLPALEKAGVLRHAALATMILARAVNQGTAYSVELDLARRALNRAALPGYNDRMFEPLAPFAAAGIAPRDQLFVRFSGVAAALDRQGAALDPDLGTLERWAEKLKRLVVIRDLRPQGGAGLRAALSRARAAVAEGKLEIAADELARDLPQSTMPAYRDAAEWAQAVLARREADHVLAGLAAVVEAGEDGAQ